MQSNNDIVCHMNDICLDEDTEVIEGIFRLNNFYDYDKLDDKSVLLEGDYYGYVECDKVKYNIKHFRDSCNAIHGDIVRGKPGYIISKIIKRTDKLIVGTLILNSKV